MNDLKLFTTYIPILEFDFITVASNKDEAINKMLTSLKEQGYNNDFSVDVDEITEVDGYKINLIKE